MCLPRTRSPDVILPYLPPTTYPPRRLPCLPRRPTAPAIPPHHHHPLPAHITLPHPPTTCRPYLNHLLFWACCGQISGGDCCELIVWLQCRHLWRTSWIPWVVCSAGTPCHSIYGRWWWEVGDGPYAGIYTTGSTLRHTALLCHLLPLPALHTCALPLRCCSTALPACLPYTALRTTLPFYTPATFHKHDYALLLTCRHAYIPTWTKALRRACADVTAACHPPGVCMRRHFITHCCGFSSWFP